MAKPTTTGRYGSIQVHRSWLANPELSDSGLRLMLWLASHGDEYLAAMNVARASTELGWSRNRIKRTTAELEALKLIETVQIQRPGGGTVTRFTLHLTRWSEPNSDGPPQTSAMVHDGTSAMVHGGAPTTSIGVLEDRVASVDNFDVGTLIKAAERLRKEHKAHRQTIIDRAKAQRLTEMTPQPPINLAALALLGEEQSLIRWKAEHTTTTTTDNEPGPASGADGLRIAREAAGRLLSTPVGDDTLVS